MAPTSVPRRCSRIVLCSLAYAVVRLLLEILIVRGHSNTRLRAEVLALRLLHRRHRLADQALRPLLHRVRQPPSPPRRLHRSPDQRLGVQQTRNLVWRLQDGDLRARSDTWSRRWSSSWATTTLPGRTRALTSERPISRSTPSHS